MIRLSEILHLNFIAEIFENKIELLTLYIFNKKTSTPKVTIISNLTSKMAYELTTYILDNTCRICLSDKTIFPVKYQCDHFFCLGCVYHNRNNLSLRQCPLCRAQTNHGFYEVSPIYKLDKNVNRREIYNNIAKTNITETTNRSNLMGKLSVIEKTLIDDTKGTSDSHAYMGYVVRINDISFTMENCYRIEYRENIRVYPTNPSTRTYELHESDLLYYCE